MGESKMGGQCGQRRRNVRRICDYRGFLVRHAKQNHEALTGGSYERSAILGTSERPQRIGFSEVRWTEARLELSSRDTKMRKFRHRRPNGKRQIFTGCNYS